MGDVGVHFGVRAVRVEGRGSLLLAGGAAGVDGQPCPPRRLPLPRLPCPLLFTTLARKSLPRHACIKYIHTCILTFTHACPCGPQNYSSGRPQARYRGAFMHVAYIALLAMVVRFTIELLLPMVKDI